MTEATANLNLVGRLSLGFAWVVAGICFWVLICLVGCNRTSNEASSESAPARNLFSPPLDEDEELATKEVERAWARYLAATGNINSQSKNQASGKETSGKKDGAIVTDEHIALLERELCQRLPAQLKAFLKIASYNGDSFHGGYRIFSPEKIGDEWFASCELIYSITVHPGIFVPDAKLDAEFYDGFLIPIMDQHEQVILIDVRNGKVIESLDWDIGPMADSIVQLLDGISQAHEEGKFVGLIGEGEPKPFLNSMMWGIYDKP